MAWNLVAPNTWSNSNSPYIIKYDNNLGQYIVENVNGENFIPLSDIFNNPAFPIDLSNADVLVKSLTSSTTVSAGTVVSGTHLRSEAANTPATPGHSFKTEINSGLYRKSAGVLGFSILGNQNGEIGAGYGGFPGNLIQVVSSTTSYSTSLVAVTFANINSGSGVVWETSIVPKLPNSKFLVIYKIQTSSSTEYFGFKILNKINSGGTYSAIYIPRVTGNDQNPTDFGNNAGTTYSQNVIFTIHSPSYNIGDTLFYKVMGAVYSPLTVTVNTTSTGTGTNSGHSEAYILEIAQ